MVLGAGTSYHHSSNRHLGPGVRPSRASHRHSPDERLPVQPAKSHLRRQKRMRVSATTSVAHVGWPAVTMRSIGGHEIGTRS